MRRQKQICLILILVTFFVVGFIAGLFPEDSPVVSDSELVGGLVSLLIVWVWCYYDSIEKGYSIGPLLRVAILLFFIIGFPVYLFKTRGRRAFVALLWTFLFIALCIASSAVGSLATYLIQPSRWS